jgi:hypothetical protein
MPIDQLFQEIHIFVIDVHRPRSLAIHKKRIPLGSTCLRLRTFSRLGNSSSRSHRAIRTKGMVDLQTAQHFTPIDRVRKSKLKSHSREENVRKKSRGQYEYRLGRGLGDVL